MNVPAEFVLEENALRAAVEAMGATNLSGVDAYGIAISAALGEQIRAVAERSGAPCLFNAQ